MDPTLNPQRVIVPNVFAGPIDMNNLTPEMARYLDSPAPDMDTVLVHDGLEVVSLRAYRRRTFKTLMHIHVARDLSKGRLDIMPKVSRLMRRHDW